MFSLQIQLLELYLILNKVWMRQVSVVNLFPGSLRKGNERLGLGVAAAKISGGSDLKQCKAHER